MAVELFPMPVEILFKLNNPATKAFIIFNLPNSLCFYLMRPLHKYE